MIFIKTTTVRQLNIKTCLKCCFGAANDRADVPRCQAARLQLWMQTADLSILLSSFQCLIDSVCVFDTLDVSVPCELIYIA